MVSEEQKLKAREIVGSWDESKRKEFLDKYNALDSSKKEVVVSRLIGKEDSKKQTSDRYDFNVQDTLKPLKTIFGPQSGPEGLPMSPQRFMQAGAEYSDMARNMIMKRSGLAGAVENVPQINLTPRLGPVPPIGTRDIARFGAEQLASPLSYMGAAGTTKIGSRLMSKIPQTATSAVEKTFKPLVAAKNLSKNIIDSRKNLDKATVRHEILKDKIDHIRQVTIPDVKEKLVDASVNDAVLYKNKIRPLSRENSKIYKQGLDQAEAKATITQSKVKSIIDSTIDEAVDQNIPNNSPVLVKLKELAEKFGPKSEEYFDYNTATNSTRFIDDKLSIEQLRNLKSELFKIADNSQEGADDVANAIFMKNYGKEIAEQSSDFASMQSEYGPWVEAKKWAYRVFKPFTKDEIPNGNRVLRNIARGKASPEDFAYLERLEEGSGRFKGTGNMRNESTSMASKLKRVSDEIFTLRKQKYKTSKEIQHLKNLSTWRDRIAIGALTVIGAGALAGPLKFIAGTNRVSSESI